MPVRAAWLRLKPGSSIWRGLKLAWLRSILQNSQTAHPYRSIQIQSLKSHQLVFCHFVLQISHSTRTRIHCGGGTGARRRGVSPATRGGPFRQQRWKDSTRSTKQSQGVFQTSNIFKPLQIPGYPHTRITRPFPMEIIINSLSEAANPTPRRSPSASVALTIPLPKGKLRMRQSSEATECYRCWDSWASTGTASSNQHLKLHKLTLGCSLAWPSWPMLAVTNFGHVALCTSHMENAKLFHQIQKKGCAWPPKTTSRSASKTRAYCTTNSRDKVSPWYVWYYWYPTSVLQTQRCHPGPASGIASAQSPQMRPAASPGLRYAQNWRPKKTKTPTTRWAISSWAHLLLGQSYVVLQRFPCAWSLYIACPMDDPWVLTAFVKKQLAFS